MISRRRYGYAIACFSLLASGCFSQHAVDDGGEPDATDAGARCDVATAPGALRCFRGRRCAAIGRQCETYFVEYGGEPSLTCHPAVPAGAYVADAVEAGTIVFDPDAAEECLAFEATACPLRAPLESYQMVLPGAARDACDRMFTGTVPLGGACRIGAECEGGFPVLASCDTGDACPGRCVAMPGLGEACELRGGCRWPLLCGTDAVCVSGAVGAPCAHTLDCWTPLRCLPGVDGASVCTEPPGEGAPCAFAEPCASALACVGGICAAPASDGESCGAERPCADGLRCVASRCAYIAAPSEACDGATRVCPHGFACERTRCQPLPALGDACDARRACVQGLCAGGVCVGLSTGEPCDTHSALDACAGHCEDGRCRAVRDAGGACRTTRGCADGLVCVAGACAACDGA